MLLHRISERRAQMAHSGIDRARTSGSRSKDLKLVAPLAPGHGIRADAAEG